ncbi:MAG: branched-chain-amino-acid transaminase [Planctomycetota bacterium]|jgi:branched-chain amino acid aminotransferase|nr:branched-chain-amino-acid transaminase [Planctomycetota bacterium]
MAEPLVYLDGEFKPKSQAAINVFDHGFLYGDGLFEGIRAYNGRVFLCREHLDRFYDGANCLAIKLPLAKKEMREVLYESLKRNGLRDAYIRLIATRGVGDLGLSPLKCAGRGSIICIAASITLYPDEFYRTGMKIITSAVQRSHPECLNPRVKSLNYLSNILAKIEAINNGYEEAIMLNHRGEVAECTGDNLFIVKNGIVKTPPPSAVILEGCTRNCVIRVARKSRIEVREETLARFDVYTADELFLTGTAAELIPVVEADGRSIGSGKPGPVTLDLLAKFRRFIKAYRDPGV